MIKLPKVLKKGCFELKTKKQNKGILQTECFFCEESKPQRDFKKIEKCKEEKLEICKECYVKLFIYFLMNVSDKEKGESIKEKSDKIQIGQPLN